MKKVIGFALLCIAIGMVIMLFLSNEVLGFLIICVLICLGYHLFCRDDCK